MGNNSPNHNQYCRTWRMKRRQRVADIKLASGCVDCGYNEHACALDFDHIDASTKLFTIGPNVGAAWAKVEAEIAKCEVVCANCHRVRTVARRQ